MGKASKRKKFLKEYSDDWFYLKKYAPAWLKSPQIIDFCLKEIHFKMANISTITGLLNMLSEQILQTRGKNDITLTLDDKNNTPLIGFNAKTWTIWVCCYLEIDKIGYISHPDCPYSLHTYINNLNLNPNISS